MPTALLPLAEFLISFNQLITFLSTSNDEKVFHSSAIVEEAFLSSSSF